MLDPSSCSKEEHEASKLAYEIYVDRLMFYVTGYLSKLLGSLPAGEVDGLVFSGGEWPNLSSSAIKLRYIARAGIGEKSHYLRADVAKRLAWIGTTLNSSANKSASSGAEVVSKISGSDSKIGLYVVQTDEEEVVARMTREDLGL